MKRLGSLLRSILSRAGAASTKSVSELGTNLKSPSGHGKPAFHVKLLASHSLGNAWAGNSVNTVIFRHHAVLTRSGNQYASFYVDKGTLRIVKRDLQSDTISTHDLNGSYNLADAHNCASLGVDRAGYLHICYDHHASPLRYRRARRPHDIREWTDEMPMTGVHEERVTYPTFILAGSASPLTFLYRDGVAGKGTARLKNYDEASEAWADHPRPLLCGSEQAPWTSNPYWNNPVISADGTLHLSFVWRTHSLGAEKRVNNINIDYARSPDGGKTWQTSRGQSFRLPITQVNAETIFAVPPGSNLINQCSMAVDSRNQPHIVFFADDPDGILQYQHVWFDGRVWRHQLVSSRTDPFSLEGGGTLQIPVSRPEIVIDRKDNVFIIARGDHTKNRMSATWLAAPDYAYNPANTAILHDEDIGFAEPIIDRTRWSEQNILTMLLQRNRQPMGDRGVEAIVSEISIADFQLCAP